MKLATWHHRLPRCIRTYCSFAWINPFNGALCIRQTRTRTPTLCIRRTLSVDVTIGTPMVIFAVLLSFDCFWRLVHCTNWYTVLVHCTNSQKQSKPFVYQSSQIYQDCTNSVPIVKTVKNSQKTVKTAKMTIVRRIYKVHVRRIHKAFNGHIKTAEQRAVTAVRWLVHWPLMGGLLHLIQRGGAWAGCDPAQSPLAVPNVTAHPSTASLPTSYYSMWQYNCHCTIKGSTNRAKNIPTECV